jgi:hypothetical protein
VSTREEALQERIWKIIELQTNGYIANDLADVVTEHVLDFLEEEKKELAKQLSVIHQPDCCAVATGIHADCCCLPEEEVTGL